MSCWDGQLLNHTIPRQAVSQYLVPILLPVTDNFLNQWKRETFFSKKECAGLEDRSPDCCFGSGHATDRATTPVMLGLILGLLAYKVDPTGYRPS